MGRRWEAWILFVSLCAGISPSMASFLKPAAAGCTMACCRCGGRCCMMRGRGGKMSSVCPMMAAMRKGSHTVMNCGCSIGQPGAAAFPGTRGEFCYILPQTASLPVEAMASFRPVPDRVSPAHGFYTPPEPPPKDLL
jgi:hypothetical protein